MSFLLLPIKLSYKLSPRFLVIFWKKKHKIRWILLSKINSNLHQAWIARIVTYDTDKHCSRRSENVFLVSWSVRLLDVQDTRQMIQWKVWCALSVSSNTIQIVYFTCYLCPVRIIVVFKMCQHLRFKPFLSFYFRKQNKK